MDYLQLALTRRRLIQVGGSAVAVAYLSRLPALALADTTAPGFLRRSSYATLVGSQFQAVGGGAVLTLTAISDLARATVEPAFVGRDDAFALAFAGPADVLTSGTHELGHPTLGSFAVFITPVGRPQASQTYELIVDRSVTLAAARQAAPAPIAAAGGDPGAAADVGPARAAAAAGGDPTAARTKAGVAPIVELATVARRAGVLAADVRVAPDAGIVSVRASLFRGRVEYARAVRLLRGRPSLRLDLRELRPVAAGDYVLHVTTTDHRGRRALIERHVTVA